MEEGRGTCERALPGPQLGGSRGAKGAMGGAAVASSRGNWRQETPVVDAPAAKKNNAPVSSSLQHKVGQRAKDEEGAPGAAGRAAAVKRKGTPSRAEPEEGGGGGARAAGDGAAAAAAGATKLLWRVGPEKRARVAAEGPVRAATEAWMAGWEAAAGSCCARRELPADCVFPAAAAAAAAAASKFVLSSGRRIRSSKDMGPVLALDLDDEFEEYFSQLLL